MYVKLYFKYLSNSYILFVCCDVYGDNDEQSLVLGSLLSCVQMEDHALSHGTNSVLGSLLSCVQMEGHALSHGTNSVLGSLLSCVQMEGHALSHGTNSDCLPVSLALYGSLLAQKELGPGTVKLALFHFKIVKYEIV